MSDSSRDCVGVGRCRSGSGLLLVLGRRQPASGLPGSLSLRNRAAERQPICQLDIGLSLRRANDIRESQPFLTLSGLGGS